MRTYHNFDLLTQDPVYDGNGHLQSYTVLVYNSPAGQGERKDPVEIADYACLIARNRQLAERRLDTDLAAQKQFGSRLADLLLPPYARGLYERSRAAVGNDGLRLRLRLLTTISPLPWEMLYLAGDERGSGGFIALDPNISITRHEVIAEAPAWAEAGDTRRVVVAMATPPPYGKYRRLDHLPEERRKIKDVLQAVPGVSVEWVPVYDAAWDLQAQPGASLPEVSRALLPYADVFHFSGHGDFLEELGVVRGTEEGNGVVILVDSDSRQAAPVPAERLAEVLRGSGVRLVTLGACETARRDPYHVQSSVVAALLRGRIPCVVAMQFSVLDDLAAAFVADFYGALADGWTIDEAVSRGRQAMRINALGPRANVRDWAAPVLYSRVEHPFPPIGDAAERERVHERLEQRTRLHETWWAWMSRGATASASQLQALGAEESLELSPVQTLILLRSAVACDEPVQPWLNRLRADGSDLIAQMVSLDRDETTVSGEVERLLGLTPQSGALDPVSWAAVKDTDPVIRHTAALALTALAPAPQEGLKRLEDALQELHGRDRWWRRAELRGMLADADPEIEALNAGYPPWDRIGIWFWRVRRRLGDEGSNIRQLVLGSALGAGAALGLFRGLLGFCAGPGTRTLAAVSLFWGGFLGAAIGLGIGLARPLLLPQRWQRRSDGTRSWRVALLSTVLGTLLFGIAHALTAWFNLAQLGEKALFFATALLVGVSVSASLHDLPCRDRRLSALGWLIRLATVVASGILAQWVVFASGRAHEAMAISRTAEAYEFYYFNWSVFLLHLARDFPRAVSYADAAGVAFLLAVGISAGVARVRKWEAKLGGS